MDSFYGNSYQSNGGEKDFQKLAQLIGTNIQKISQNVSSMNRMVNQLNTVQDATEVRKQLHQISHYTQQLSKDTSHNLKELNEIRSYSSQTDQRQLKIQKERLAESFTSALNAFQAIQRKAYDKENAELMKRTKASSSTGKLPPPPGSKYQNGYSNPNENQNDQTQIQILDEVNLQVVEQEQAIRQLENDISDVNQIFKELGTLVHNQGEIIDSIEANVQITNVSVQEATGQLRRATDYTNKLRKKRFYLLVICAVILIIITLTIVWGSK
ncbi:syntaxin-7-like [Rhopalosiphum maidis]|uniref:Syntaxin-7 n=2 Tax=Schizaphis graminum TaxID=13262 RepID=A0A2S2PP25_SCHGA|nr:syntaxin-7-like [Rhopalosiphum maidis]XP_060834516.1 syntaxin-7-like [Rhopalosiphum padi]